MIKDIIDYNAHHESYIKRKFLFFLKGEELKIILTIVFVLLRTIVNLAAPFLLGHIIDNILSKNVAWVDIASLIALLLALYVFSSFASYIQTLSTGRLGQSILFKVRAFLFDKIQRLPVTFFKQNKTGDLISRINNDTDRLNQLFSETLIRFLNESFTILSIGILVVVLSPKLGSIAIISAIILFIVTRLIAPVLGRANKAQLEALGNITAETQEYLNNFRLISAYSKEEYMKKNLNKALQTNYKAALKTALINSILLPLYDLSSNFSILLVLLFGISMVGSKEITIGFLISYLSYTDKFYQPLRVFASLISNIEGSLAAWGRISQILNLKSHLKVEKRIEEPVKSEHVLSFSGVNFEYEEKKPVLIDVNLDFVKGETYAIIGPTGGGKSTIASLMVRLYDPTTGTVKLMGSDIKTYGFDEISNIIGFILQESIIFTGTVADNILYGNRNLKDKAELERELKEMDLLTVLKSFKDGLDTKVTTENGGNISNGQKQVIAFLRIILRKPKVLILDEATANIDTVTEAVIQNIMDRLPSDTTKIIIAHRLNTIRKADEIYFISGGVVQKALSFEKALELVKSTKTKS